MIGTTNVQSFSKSATSSSPATLDAFVWTFTKSGYYIWQNYNSILVTSIVDGLNFSDNNGCIYNYISKSSENLIIIRPTMIKASEWTIHKFIRAQTATAPSSSASGYSVMNNFGYDDTEYYEIFNASNFVSSSQIYNFGTNASSGSSSCSGSWQLKLYGSKL